MNWLPNKPLLLFFGALLSFSVFANEERHANSPPPATNPQNPQSQMNNQNPSSVNQQMLSCPLNTSDAAEEKSR